MGKGTPPAPPDPVWVSRFLTKLSGNLAFDIGGNNGEVAAKLARRFRRVVSFEPAEESYEMLRRLATQRPNITAVNIAVSDHEGEVELAAQETSIKTGQLTSPDPNQSEADLALSWGRILDRRVIPCRTLDALVVEYGVPDFVKIDVEGHEVRVVEGGLETLLTHQPSLYIEIHNRELGHAIVRLLLKAYGDRLEEIAHPSYRGDEWAYDNHYWIVAE